MTTDRSDIDLLPVGHRVRRTAAWALGVTITQGTAFSLFAYVTTQDRGVRAGSPWQNDPYHGVVSFTEFLVPAVILVVLMRATLWRRSEPQPAFRVHQLMRSGVVITVLVGATVLTDWFAVAVDADRPSWNGTTPWLIAGLAPLSMLTVAGLVLQRAALQGLPRTPRGRPDGDWLDDLSALTQQLTGSPAQRPIAFLRRHIIVFAALLSLLASLGITTAEAVGEGWSSPLLFATGTLIGLGGFFAFCLVCNVVLHIAVPHDRPADRRRKVAQMRRATRVAVIAGSLALPVSAVSRDRIWSVLDHRGEVDSVGVFASIVVVSAIITATLAFTVTYAASPRSTSDPSPAAPFRPSRRPPRA